MRVTRLSGSEGGGILRDSPYPYSDCASRVSHWFDQWFATIRSACRCRVGPVGQFGRIALNSERSLVKRSPVKRGLQLNASEDFNLVDEVTYIQQRAATRVGRIVTVGPVLLFSTEEGEGCVFAITVTYSSSLGRPVRTR
jgi:hypothetical protein